MVALKESTALFLKTDSYLHMSHIEAELPEFMCVYVKYKIWFKNDFLKMQCTVTKLYMTYMVQVFLKALQSENGAKGFDYSCIGLILNMCH